MTRATSLGSPRAKPFIVEQTAAAGDQSTRLWEEFRQLTSENFARCTQCGRCTAGCPLASDMDLSPTRVLRSLQLGQVERAARSLAIWFCVSCQVCTTRCPQEVDIAHTMDSLRELARRHGLEHPGSRDILSFHRSLLAVVRRYGRLREFPLVRGYKLRTWHFFQDLLVAPRLFFRGKIHLLPKEIAAVEAVRQVFARSGVPL